MNAIELFIIREMPKWHYVGYKQHYTTVINGYGFVLRRVNEAMMLSGLSREYVKTAMECHKPKDSNEIVVCEPSWTFTLPASDAFVCEVIISHNPEVFP
jgi:hypothetical protein